MESLLRVKDEFIFVMSKLLCVLRSGGVKSQIEVFDVTRGVWRQFGETGDNLWQGALVQISGETFAYIGGRNEVWKINVKNVQYGVP